ncbi:MAG TPA: HAD family hydrolase, partial [Smithellaceae bacterium]|nr:HAD family hydrolase [Smithellaceae bacterium]
ALAIVSCTKKEEAAQSPAVGDVIKIGHFAALTGETATFGQSTKKGVDLDKFMEVSGDLLEQVDYKEMQPITPMVAVVAQMRKNNILLVVSSNNSQTIHTALEQFKFKDYFEKVLGSDFLLSKKEKMLYAKEKYQVEPKDIYYIGDTTGDIREGRAAGVKTVGVTWGWHSKAKMAAAKPDYLVHTPEDLLQLS